MLLMWNDSRNETIRERCRAKKKQSWKWVRVQKYIVDWADTSEQKQTQNMTCPIVNDNLRALSLILVALMCFPNLFSRANKHQKTLVHTFLSENVTWWLHCAYLLLRIMHLPLNFLLQNGCWLLVSRMVKDTATCFFSNDKLTQFGLYIDPIALLSGRS